MSPDAPPRAARWLLSVLTPSSTREFLMGDLEEQFTATVRAAGRPRAVRRYWRQAVGAIRQLAWLRPARAGAGAPGRRGGDRFGPVWRDVLFGGRTAWRSPGYSLIAAGTMALAIGANTLLFSLANPLVLRALPIRNSSTLGWILEENHASGAGRGLSSMPDFLEWRARTKAFADLAARASGSATLTGNGDAERVETILITPNLSEMWGLHALLGRTIAPGDDVPGRDPAVVLTSHYWRQHFHGDPSVVGRTIFLDAKPATIVGVLDAQLELFGYAAIDLWMPLRLDPAAPRDARSLRVVGRLAPGATLASATAEIRTFAGAEARAHPDADVNWVPAVVSTRAAMTGPDTWVLLGLLAVVVVFVLLIACANLANLMLARLVRLRLDFAVRQALGASRLQLVRPLLCESLLLGACGGLAGLGIAYSGLRIINAIAFDGLLRQVGIDGNVLIFSAALSLLTPLLFTLWPAMGAGRAGTAETLREVRSSGGRRAGRRRNVLVASQVALALSLLVVSGLVLRTVMNYQHVDLGLDVPHVLTFQVEPPAYRYPDAPAQARFAADAVRSLGGVPGVERAAAVSRLPVFDAEVTRTVTGTRHDGASEKARPWVSWYAATPDFFGAAGLSLLAGRSLAPSDEAGREPVAVLGRTAATKYFDGVEEALGRTLVVSGLGRPDRRVTIVGVVSDTRDSQFTGTGPQMYVPFAQWPSPAMTLVVRSASLADRSADVRAAMRRLDAAVAIATPKTLAQLVRENTSDNAIVNGLFLGFALLALTLAGAGLYGVIAYSVGQRQREIGVRLALGAAPAQIRRMVFGESLRVTGAGVLVGLVLAAVLARASASVLFGVSAGDPLTFGSVTLLVLVVSLAAVWQPAARAMRIDPARTLRAE